MSSRSRIRDDALGLEFDASGRRNASDALGGGAPAASLTEAGGREWNPETTPEIRDCMGDRRGDECDV